MSDDGQIRRDRHQVGANWMQIASRPLLSFDEMELGNLPKEVLQFLVIPHGIHTHGKSCRQLVQEVLRIQSDIRENAAREADRALALAEQASSVEDNTSSPSRSPGVPAPKAADSTSDGSAYGEHKSDHDQENVPPLDVVEEDPPQGDVSTRPASFVEVTRGNRDPIVPPEATQAFQFGNPIADPNNFGVLQDDTSSIASSLRPDNATPGTDQTPAGNTVPTNSENHHPTQLGAMDGSVESYTNRVVHTRTLAPIFGPSPFRNQPMGSTVPPRFLDTSLPRYSDISENVAQQLRSMGLAVTRDDLRSELDIRDARLRTRIKTDVEDMLAISTTATTEVLESRLDDHIKKMDAKLSPIIQHFAQERTFPATRNARRSLNFDHIPTTPPGASGIGHHGHFRNRPVNLTPVNEHPSEEDRSQDEASVAGSQGGQSRPPLTTHHSPIGRRNPYKGGMLVAHSPINDAKRGKRYSEYLFGEYGLSVDDIQDYLDEMALLELELGLDTHDNIRNSVTNLLQDWKTPSISNKHLATFKPLESLSPEDFVVWYSNTRYAVARYDVGLMPFDAIVLKWAFVGLCYPGVGGNRYLQMASALYEILDATLPKEVPLVRDVMHTQEGFHQDGYRLLNSLLIRFMPVFCASIPATPPMWPDVLNVSRMAKLWLLHFRLVAKSGSSFSDTERSLLFLDSIQEHSMLPSVQSLKSSIMLFTESIDEFDRADMTLPTHLTIEGLVTTLTSTLSPLTNSLTYASSNYTHGSQLALQSAQYAPTDPSLSLIHI